MLAVHRAQATRTVQYLQRHGIPAQLGAAHGEAVDIIGIPEQQMARAISIASDVSDTGAPYSVLSNGRKWLSAASEIVIPFVAAAALGLLFVPWLGFVGAGLWLVWLAVRDYRGAYRSARHPLPKQSWESDKAYNGRRTMGRLMAPWAALAGCAMVLITIALFGGAAWLAWLR